MEVLVCVKRVPGASGRVTLTDDGRAVDARHVGWTVSPHEESAVECAVQAVEAQGGSATVLTVGPEDSLEQMRDALAMGVGGGGAGRGGRRRLGSRPTSRPRSPTSSPPAGRRAPVRPAAVRQRGRRHRDFQVGIRVAYRLGLPVVGGVKTFEVKDGRRWSCAATARTVSRCTTCRCPRC